MSITRPIAVLVAMAGVAVALCAWLFPFQPIGRSPLDRSIASAPAERRPQKPEQSAEKTVEKEAEAVIDDPDGYTNIRSAPGTRSEITSRVINGEVFDVLSMQGPWWQVRTKDGKYGYMHRSRISLIR